MRGPIARRAAGGGTTKVRLVKGANLAMETVEAELHGWIAAPYGSKAEVDASYKALVESALRPDWAGALRIGLASHNLFDVAWALCLRDEFGARDRIDFEMLEGMAPAQARQVHAAAGGLLMYAPVVADDDFTACLAYLTRRLDENTSRRTSCARCSRWCPTHPRSIARRPASVPPSSTAAPCPPRAAVRPRARRLSSMPDGARSATSPTATSRIPPCERRSRRRWCSRPDRRSSASPNSTRSMRWSSAPPQSFRRAEHCRRVRRQWLLDVADVMGAERADTVALMAHEVGKTVHEGDPEVSEAIDFCRYDATEGSAVLDAAEAAGLRVDGRGVVVVVGPWNFPYAIPTGGIAAAIAAGNSVILKPAPEAVATGAWIVEQFRRAGVPA